MGLPWSTWGVISAVILWAGVAAGRPIICEDTTTEQLIAIDGPCPSGQTEFKAAGANLFDVFWASSTGQNREPGTPAGKPSAESLAELSTYKAAGLRVFRAFASDWGPNKKFWAMMNHRAQYWAEFDEVMAAIDTSGLYFIPSLGTDNWAGAANAIYPGLNETDNDCVINASSASRKLALEYFGEFTARYHNRSSILMWELGNELNLQVNLPPPFCGGQKCFNTAQMVGFTQALVTKIREVDTVRPVSSGFSMPRSDAWHMEHCPAPTTCDMAGLEGTHPTHWTPGDWVSLRSRCPQSAPCPADPASTGFWAVDDRQQWTQIITQQNKAVSVWSVHHYAPHAANPNASCYFSHGGPDCVSNASVITAAAAAATAADVMLYVGEYGGPGPNFTGPTAGARAFPTSVLELQVADAHAGGPVALTTIWAWECPLHRADMVCIWPNSTDPRESGSNKMIAVIQDANAKLAATSSR